MELPDSDETEKEMQKKNAEMMFWLGAAHAHAMWSSLAFQNQYYQPQPWGPYPEAGTKAKIGGKPQKADKHSRKNDDKVGNAGSKVEECSALPDGPVEGRVWLLSRDPVGCRQVQAAIDSAADDDARERMLAELEGNILEAIHCKHANFVVQKFIITMRPEALEFVVREIQEGAGSVSKMARHVFGCRVIQRLMEHCSRNQVERLVDEILEEPVSLCRNQFGNYVGQQIMEFGSPEQQSRLMKAVEADIRTLCTDYYAVGVVDKILSSGALTERLQVARTIIKTEGLLVTMARSRHGHEAVKQLLDGQGVEVRDETLAVLRSNMDELKQSRYGRVLAKYMQSQSEGQNGNQEK